MTTITETLLQSLKRYSHIQLYIKNDGYKYFINLDLNAEENTKAYNLGYQQHLKKLSK